VLWLQVSITIPAHPWPFQKFLFWKTFTFTEELQRQ
jgi:hypothetical protein